MKEIKTIKIAYLHELPDDFTGKAIISYNGTIIFFKNGLYHRENGLPAVEYVNDYKSYFIEGKQHRIGGPAVEYANGFNEYYINGEQVSKEAHDLLYNLVKLKEIL